MRTVSFGGWKVSSQTYMILKSYKVFLNILAWMDREYEFSFDPLYRKICRLDNIIFHIFLLFLSFVSTQYLHYYATFSTLIKFHRVPITALNITFRCQNTWMLWPSYMTWCHLTLQNKKNCSQTMVLSLLPFSLCDANK